jgi:hypothetical protein
VCYRYSPDRKGEHPQRHLKSYRGKLQVDAYAGFEALFVPPAPVDLPRFGGRVVITELS